VKGEGWVGVHVEYVERTCGLAAVGFRVQAYICAIGVQ